MGCQVIEWNRIGERDATVPINLADRGGDDESYNDLVIELLKKRNERTPRMT